MLALEGVAQTVSVAISGERGRGDEQREEQRQTRERAPDDGVDERQGTALFGATLVAMLRRLAGIAIASSLAHRAHMPGRAYSPP